METTIENVTPRKASQWLNKNVCNRKLREGGVEKYAADMASGKWTECLAPIAFYDDGEIADGQHRLYAIVESDTTQQFIVARGVPRDAALNIDTGMTRTLVDNARISGSDDLSTALIVAARAINDGIRNSGVRSNAQKLEIVNRWREPAQFAASHCPRGKFLGGGPMLGAIGRAYMHEVDKERLLRFCSVLRTGFMENPGESAAVAIRNHLQSKGIQLGSTTVWPETFRKCQHAIHSFMRGRQLNWVKTVKDEAYPLPTVPGNKPTKGHKANAKRSKANGHAQPSA